MTDEGGIEVVEGVEDTAVERAGGGEALRMFIERIERINDAIAEWQEDRKDVFAELKAQGFDPAIVRQVIKRRKIEPHLRHEADSILESYEIALGMAPPGTLDGGELRPLLPSPTQANRGSGTKSKQLQEALAWAGVADEAPVRGTGVEAAR